MTARTGRNLTPKAQQCHVHDVHAHKNRTQCYHSPPPDSQLHAADVAYHTTTLVGLRQVTKEACHGCIAVDTEHHPREAETQQCMLRILWTQVGCLSDRALSPVDSLTPSRGGSTAVCTRTVSLRYPPTWLASSGVSSSSSSLFFFVFFFFNNERSLAIEATRPLIAHAVRLQTLRGTPHVCPRKTLWGSR